MHRRRPSFPSHRERSGRPPLHAERTLSPAEIQRERLLLAQDMVHLVLQDGQTLPAPIQTKLRQISETLSAMRRQSRDGL